MDRNRPCRHMGDNVSPTAFGFRRVCTLGLGTNGTCCIGNEAQTCASYRKKLPAHMEHIRLRQSLAQVNDAPGNLKGGVVRDDHELKVELLSQGHHQVPDPLPVSPPGAGELERLVEDQEPA